MIQDSVFTRRDGDPDAHRKYCSRVRMLLHLTKYLQPGMLSVR
jgi:hypothetical protein